MVVRWWCWLTGCIYLPYTSSIYSSPQPVVVVVLVKCVGGEVDRRASMQEGSRVGGMDRRAAGWVDGWTIER